MARTLQMLAWLACLGACETGSGIVQLKRKDAAPTTAQVDASMQAPDSGAASKVDPQIPKALAFDYDACKPAEVRADCDSEFCTIPAGCFVMGSPEDEFGHARVAEVRTIVTLTRAVQLQRREVTRDAWQKLGLPDPSAKRDDGTGNCTDDRNCPVGNVTWFEALAFANLMSEHSTPPLPACYRLNNCTGELGRGLACQNAELTADSVYACAGYRLPTDAEWEYAARAGSRTAFYTGAIARLEEYGTCAADPNLEPIAWYCHNSGGLTHPVGTRQPNAFGLFDMLGNVAEWVNDRSTGKPPEVAMDPGALLERDPSVVHPSRVYRGGNYRSWSTLCRASYQGSGSWDNRAPGIGFRLARTAAVK